MEVDLKQALEHGTLSAPGKGTCTACVVITPFLLFRSIASVAARTLSQSYTRETNY